ncbi:60S ACIDIC ribosomal protein FAMILY MEMBER [Anaeramoeba ignava]|uniref:60S ACIDIC ribosomal protein FAMILY MEMBER n=1 Tax=Anaeramoeba ignava TaxID=1746090 RepID=A0A9Q0RA09_ANAIG|nr:60S ACIDIC ribosomal protein FAMILY MEMBER [Anaeramoeba ignava]
MKYIAAYVLAVLGGKKTPTGKDITQILKSVGIEVDNAMVDKVVASFKGRDIIDLIQEGRTKMAGVRLGGGAPAKTTTTTTEEIKTEDKEDEKVPSDKSDKSAPKSDSSGEGDIGFGLFD